MENINQTPAELPPEEPTEEAKKKIWEAEVKKGVKANLKTIHDKYNPDYIFICETSDYYDAIAIKLAWREAYPNEAAPVFYRVDPRMIIGDEIYEGINKIYKNKDYSDRYLDGKINFFLQRIKKDNARVLVVDHSNQSDSREYVIDFIEAELCDKGVDVKGYVLDIMKFSLRGKGWSYDSLYSKVFSVRRRQWTEDEKTITDEERDKIIEDFLEGDESGKIFQARLVKHPEQKERALALLREVAMVAKRAGKELREELKEEANERDTQ